MDLSLQNYDNTGTALSFLRSTTEPSISLVKDITTTPNGIAMNPTGLAYNNGTTTTSTSWDDLSNRIASLSAVAPNALNATLLVVNNTISVQNADTAPTRVINTSAEDGTGGTHFGVAWVGNTLPFVMETLDATDLVVQDTILNVKQGGGGTNQIILNSSSATITITDGTNTNILTPVVSYPDLNAVLLTGNNAFGQSITGVNDIACSSINSTSYPPPTPSLGSVMTVNNVASTNLNKDNWDIQNVNTINGYSPVVLGLTWGDFTGSNAYSNLPSQSYQVYSYPYTSTQSNGSFTVFDANANQTSSLGSNSLVFVDNNSSTSTTYASNSINNTNGTDFTITAGNSGAQALNLNCSSLIINGVAYSVPPPPPLRWGYYQNGGQSFSASSGGYTNVGIGSSPIQYLSGMTPYGSYTIAIQFNCWVDSVDTTSSCYISYNNINGSFTGLYDTGTPCPNTTAVGVHPYGSSTQFTIQDTIIFVAGGSGELALDLFFGTSLGWMGYYKWSLSAQIVSP